MDRRLARASAAGFGAYSARSARRDTQRRYAPTADLRPHQMSIKSTAPQAVFWKTVGTSVHTGIALQPWGMLRSSACSLPTVSTVARRLRWGGREEAAPDMQKERGFSI